MVVIWVLWTTVLNRVVTWDGLRSWLEREYNMKCFLFFSYFNLKLQPTAWHQVLYTDQSQLFFYWRTPPLESDSLSSWLSIKIRASLFLFFYLFFSNAFNKRKYFDLFVCIFQDNNQDFIIFIKMFCRHYFQSLISTKWKALQCAQLLISVRLISQKKSFINIIFI